MNKIFIFLTTTFLTYSVNTIAMEQEIIKYVADTKQNQVLHRIKQYSAEKKCSNEQAAREINTAKTGNVFTLQLAVFKSIMDAREDFSNINYLLRKEKDKIDLNFTYNNNNYQDKRSFSLLNATITAVSPGALHVTRYLIEQGAQPDSQDFCDVCSQIAFMSYRYTNDPGSNPDWYKKTFDAFLKPKPLFDVNTVRDSDGNTPLLWILRLYSSSLIESDDTSRTPLYYGINTLLETGADVMYVNKKTNPPTTALSIAIQTKNKQLIDLIVSYLRKPAH